MFMVLLLFGLVFYVVECLLFMLLGLLSLLFASAVVFCLLLVDYVCAFDYCGADLVVNV